MIEVSGRTYPVEVRYRPLEADDEDDEDQDMEEAIARRGGRAVRASRPAATSSCSCPASARSARPPKRCASITRRGAEILPLYARLSFDEQERVFKPLGGAAHRARDQRRRDVADGARHPLRDRHRPRARQPLQLRNKVEQLQIEKISQASANQRAGRCGRVGAGHLRPALLRRRFRGRARVHRSGDPAHVARVA